MTLCKDGGSFSYSLFLQLMEKQVRGIAGTGRGIRGAEENKPRRRKEERCVRGEYERSSGNKEARSSWKEEKRVRDEGMERAGRKNRK